ncbi:MAG TPA: response regulator [Parafilimonas sp.]|nr:response regulator [Parafilimonas sp.]
MKLDPIIIIDDDEEDCELLKIGFQHLDIKNQLIVFNSSRDALTYLQSFNGQVFFILCDINMPVMDGITLRRKINENEALRFKSIPFLFLSTSGSEQVVNNAYSLNIQGYFKKPNSVKEIQQILSRIISYWDTSYRPSITQ